MAKRMRKKASFTDKRYMYLYLEIHDPPYHFIIRCYYEVKTPIYSKNRLMDIMYMERHTLVYAIPYGDPSDPLIPPMHFSTTVEPFDMTPIERIVAEQQRRINNLHGINSERPHGARGNTARNSEGNLGTAALPEPDLIHHCTEIKVGNRTKMFILRNRNIQADIVEITPRKIFLRFRILRQNYVQICYAIINNTAENANTFTYLGVEFTIEVGGDPPYLWIKIRENN